MTQNPLLPKVSPSRGAGRQAAEASCISASSACAFSRSSAGWPAESIAIRLGAKRSSPRLNYDVATGPDRHAAVIRRRERNYCPAVAQIHDPRRGHPRRRLLGPPPAATTATTATPSGQCRSDNYLGCTEKTFTGAGPTVADIGDSITYESRTQHHNTLDGYSVKVSGLIGSTAAENIAIARQYAPDHPAAVVTNVGTNDALLSIPTTDTIAAYDQIISQFADSCVVLVTISELGTGTTTDGHVYSPDHAAAINAWMRARHEHVVDWEAALAADPTLVVDDGMHPTDAGKQRLADLIAAGVSTCPSANAAN